MLWGIAKGITNACRSLDTGEGGNPTGRRMMISLLSCPRPLQPRTGSKSRRLLAQVLADVAPIGMTVTPVSTQVPFIFIDVPLVPIPVSAILG